MSLPRMNRKVLLSPRSVVLSTFQFSKLGSNGRPLNSALCRERSRYSFCFGSGVLRQWVGLDGCICPGSKIGFEYCQLVGRDYLASGCSFLKLGSGIAPSWIIFTAS